MTNNLPPAASQPIPVTILAGFLGSGKTTLLNRILHAEHGMRMAVLVNDFGEVNIDAQLIDGDQASEMISLPNGCICCTLFGNLVDVLLKLTRLAEPPDHILIEASGVSQPHQISDILTVTDLQEHLHLDGIITLVDAENVRKLSKVVMFIEGQLTDADIIILNKLDLVAPDSVDELMAWIRESAPDARIIPATYADVPLEFVFGASTDGRDISPIAGEHDHDHSHHGLEFETWLYSSDKSLASDAFLRTLEELPTGIYRGKGIVLLADKITRRTIMQMVGKRIQFHDGGEWGDEPKTTELVFIGEPMTMSSVELSSLFEACQTDMTA
jgi:G3E family GTPase